VLVDTQGLIIRVLVHPADLSDRDGAMLLLAPLQGQLPRLQHIWANRAYTSKFADLALSRGCELATRLYLSIETGPEPAMVPKSDPMNYLGVSSLLSSNIPPHVNLNQSI
jgi:hypothetical protein